MARSSRRMQATVNKRLWVGGTEVGEAGTTLRLEIWKVG
jgi:hypothetical protein